MADITNKCKEIIQELENNIKDSSNLEFAKQQVFNLLESFLEEIEKIQETAEKRIEKLLRNQIELDKRISSIEDDIYEGEETEGDEDLTISCPYCEYVFSVLDEELKDEIICPQCNSTISLPWFDEHECHCEDCEDCEDDCHCDDCDDYEDDEEDM